AAMAQRPAQIGARPVENRHEIVADDLDAAVGEITHRNLVIGDVLAPVALLLFHVFGNRQTFHHVPGEPRGRAVLPDAYLLVALSYFFLRPHYPVRDMMKRTDHADSAGLGNIINAGEVLGAEPTPSL